MKKQRNKRKTRNSLCQWKYKPLGYWVFGPSLRGPTVFRQKWRGCQRQRGCNAAGKSTLGLQPPLEKPSARCTERKLEFDVSCVASTLADVWLFLVKPSRDGRGACGAAEGERQREGFWEWESAVSGGGGLCLRRGGDEKTTFCSLSMLRTKGCKLKRLNRQCFK